jgi:hypothetical protein
MNTQPGTLYETKEEEATSVYTYRYAESKARGECAASVYGYTGTL